MAVPSIALAYKRTALMTATKVTVKPPSEDVLRARDNFADFCIAMGKKPAKHMLEWHNQLCTGEDTECLMGIGGPNTAILAPRGSAKSTVLGLFAAWMIGRHAAAKKMLRILYIAYMVDISRAKSATIKGILTSNKYREIFPMVRLSKIKRSDEYWSIDYDFAGIDTAGEEAFTIACGGLKGAITSKRSQLVLIDDPIKSAASINNPDIRREMEQTWSNVIAPTMFQGARAICLGTRFHYDDIHATLFVPKNNWKQIIQKAVITDADGKQRSYWPEFWSMKYLNERKMEDRLRLHISTNTAVKSTDVGISPEPIIKAPVPEDYDCLGVGTDLSAGLREKNDWTVMTLGGIKEGKIYMIDQRRARTMGNLEKMDSFVGLADWNILLENDEGQFSQQCHRV